MGLASRSILIVTLAACLGLASACSKSRSSSSSTSGNGEPPPQLTMDKMKVQSFGPDGLEWVLVTPTAQGFSQQNKMHAQNLLITFYRNGRKATDLSANEGILHFEDSRATISTATPVKYMEGNVGLGPGDMYLKGNVVAVSTDGSKLYTDWLLYNKTAGIVSSTAPVRVVREDSITTGIGLRANADLSSVEIFDQTVVVKERPKKKSS